MKYFNSNFFMATNMCDCRQRMTAVAFMQIAQDMAVLGAEGLGFGYQVMRNIDSAWVLSRMHVHFDSLPTWRTDVNLKTWHKGPSGPFFLRDFILTDAEGREAVKATSSWVVMNLTERRMMRFDSLTDIIPTNAEHTDHAIETPAAKVVIPRTAELLSETTHKVVFSDVDFNMHANNTRYVEWCMDTIPFDYLREKTIRDLTINYLQEAKAGDELALRCFRPAANPEAPGAEDCIRFVEVSCEGKPMFTCKLVFE